MVRVDCVDGSFSLMTPVSCSWCAAGASDSGALAAALPGRLSCISLLAIEAS